MKKSTFYVKRKKACVLLGRRTTGERGGGEGAIHNIAEVRLVTRLSYPEGASGVYKPTKLPILHEKLGWLNW